MGMIRSRSWRIVTGVAIAALLISVGCAWHILPAAAFSKKSGATWSLSGAPRLEIAAQPGVVVTDLGKRDGLVVAIQGEDTVLERQCQAEFALANAGDLPLELTLERLCCECVNGVMLDGAPLVPRQPVMLAADGREVTLRVKWIVARADVKKEEVSKLGRIYAQLRTNDPERPAVRLEITTRLATP
jgi:hypothetical protein